MFDLEKDCQINLLSESSPIINFDCGNKDLNDFFCEDALKYQNELLGETYFFTLLKSPNRIVCSFTISNDSVKVYDLPNSRKKKVRQDIPNEKAMKSYPAALIGRLGVASDFASSGIGSQLIDFIKSFCLIEYGNRCRFLLVDAYNEDKVLRFYQKNEFRILFSTEQQEQEYYNNNAIPLKTRFMYFDLLAWKYL